MNSTLRSYFAEIGRRGGRKSRRTLRPDQVRRVVRVREARRACRRSHAQCFWSCPPDLVIDVDDVARVAEQLVRNGGDEAWAVGAGSCC